METLTRQRAIQRDEEVPLKNGNMSTNNKMKKRVTAKSSRNASKKKAHANTSTITTNKKKMKAATGQAAGRRRGPSSSTLKLQRLMREQAAETRVWISELNCHDVLLGRGRAVVQTSGNVNFRRIVWEYKQEYRQANNATKISLAQMVVNRIADLEPPGRFVERVFLDNDKTNDFSLALVSNSRALEKACQALRELKNTKPRNYDDECNKEKHPMVRFLNETNKSKEWNESMNNHQEKGDGKNLATVVSRIGKHFYRSNFDGGRSQHASLPPESMLECSVTPGSLTSSFEAGTFHGEDEDEDETMAAGLDDIHVDLDTCNLSILDTISNVGCDSRDFIPGSAARNGVGADAEDEHVDDLCSSLPYPLSSLSSGLFSSVGRAVDHFTGQVTDRTISLTPTSSNNGMIMLETPKLNCKSS